VRPAKTIFAVRTHRPRDTVETVEISDEHFCGNGPLVRMMAFDDSSAVNHQKYFSPLEQTMVSDLSYVDLTEKTQFIGFLNRDLLTAFHGALGHG
jgi:hypothetical protein